MSGLLKHENSPKYFGPGYWSLLHTIAANTVTSDDLKSVVYVIKTISKKLFCEKCRLHFLDYLEGNPVENHMNDSYSLFIWTCKAHNNANKITGKKLVTDSQMAKLYNELRVVSSYVERSHLPPPPPEPVRHQSPSFVRRHASPPPQVKRYGSPTRQRPENFVRPEIKRYIAKKYIRDDESELYRMFSGR